MNMSFILSIVFDDDYKLFLRYGVILMFFVDGRLGLRRGREVRVSRDDQGERGVLENQVKS